MDATRILSESVVVKDILETDDITKNIYHIAREAVLSRILTSQLARIRELFGINLLNDMEKMNNYKNFHKNKDLDGLSKFLGIDKYEVIDCLYRDDMNRDTLKHIINMFRANPDMDCMLYLPYLFLEIN